MKILYCIAGTYNAGGMERVLANKANYLVAHGYEVIIVTTDQRGRMPFFRLDERIACYDLGINYEENNGKTFLNKLLHYPVKQWKHRLRLSKLLKRQRMDVVISMFCNDASFLPTIRDGSKKILEIHFSRFKRLQYGRKGIWRLADEWRSKNDMKIADRFDRFVVLTKEDRSYWGAIQQLQVIPNARTFVCEQPAKLQEKRVMAVGRYSYQKGFERLIEAWRLVCQKEDGWLLEIVGDGELRVELLQQIEWAGLQKNVTLKRVQTGDMKEAYAGVSVLALSSRYEGLPMVLLEAQAAGLPIVSFACKCGPRDVVEEGVNGFLVEEGDVRTLAERLLCLMKNQPLRNRMGQAAFQNSEQYDEEKIMREWMALFDDLSEKKRKR